MLIKLDDEFVNECKAANEEYNMAAAALDDAKTKYQHATLYESLPQRQNAAVARVRARDRYIFIKDRRDELARKLIAMLSQYDVDWC